MPVHYPKKMVGRCKQAKLVPVSIAVGIDIQWQGGVDVPTQLKLLEFMQDCQKRFPVEQLPEYKKREPKQKKDAAPPAPGQQQPGTDTQQKQKGKNHAPAA